MLYLKLTIIFLCIFNIVKSTTEIKLPDNLDRYLLEKESHFSDIIPNTEKKIFWYNNNKEKTKYSIVYLHGFSATRQEVAPLCNEIANELKANVFYTRFSGHGRNGKAMANVSVNDWKRDVIEALSIGKRIGEKVIVIGTSTGGTLATWYAVNNTNEQNIIYILISPNYRMKDRAAFLLDIPILREIIANFFMKERNIKAHSKKEKIYWTLNYPTKALFPLGEIVRESRKYNYSKLTQKILIMHTSKDKVVNSKETDKIFKKLKGKNKKLIVINSVSKLGNHVLAGDIMSPNTTEEIKKKIINFIKK